MFKVPRVLKTGVALVAAVGVGVAGFGAHTALASPGTGYYVEFNGYSCVTGGSSCPIQDEMYADLIAVSFAGSSGSRPDGVTLECANYYYDPQGNLHYQELLARVGPTSQEYDGGTPTGLVNVQPNANQYSTSTQTSVAAGGSDPYTGVSGEATGYGTIDNVSEQLLSGSATITLSGWFSDYNYGTYHWTQHAKFGSATCSVGLHPNLGGESESLAVPYDIAG